MKTLNVLGMDYGASSGKAVAGIFDGNRLLLKEIRRFENTPVILSTGIYWNILMLYQELKNSIVSAEKSPGGISSVGIDTWAQDFGILDTQGNLLGFPRHYRDPRRIDGFEEVTKLYPEYELFCKSGMVPSDVCTLFQLVSMKESGKVALRHGSRLLFIPDILTNFLTGEVNCDSTIASMTGMYIIPQKDWNKGLLEKLEIPDLLPCINSHSGVAGIITDSEFAGTGAAGIPVVTVAQHDTASALTTISFFDEGDTVYISCGTWAVTGAPVKEPVINRSVFEKGFSNELGYKNRNYLVKNMTGLWILQECVREWKQNGCKIDYDYFDEYTGKNPAKVVIDVEDEVFMQPGGMNSKIADYCRRTGQTPPSCREEVYSCIVYSLASKFSRVINELEILTGLKYKKVHIVGGGSKCVPLCRLIGDNTGMNVAAGPHEATVIGNIMAQLDGGGEVNESDMKSIALRSFPLEYY